MEDTDETEILDIEKSSFELRVHQVPKSSKEKTIQNNRTTITNVDFSKVNAEKKRVGDVGEAMVLNYEKKRLMDAGKSELAEKVEHVSVTQGDGLGYDIKSYQEDGTPLYIEVKTTKQNIKADFYLSKREKNVANLMYEKGEKYRIYRVYNLNPHLGKGDLIIYETLFDDEYFSMEPENWKVKLKY